MSLIPKPELPTNAKSPSQQNMRFSLTHMRRKGKYSCNKLTKKQTSEIIEKLRHYKKMTRAQFDDSSGVRLKRVKKRGFPAPPSDLSQEVEDALGFEFRASKKCRILGYLHMSVFYIMMIDPEHKYCN